VVLGAALTLLMAAVGAVGLRSLGRMGAAAGALRAEVEGLGAAAAAGEEFAAIGSALRDMCIDMDLADNLRQEKAVGAGVARLRGSVKRLQGQSGGDPEKRAAAERAARAAEAYFGAAEEVVDLAMANKNAEAARRLRDAAGPAAAEFGAGLAELGKLVRDRAEARAGESGAAPRAFRLALAAAVALGLAASALLSVARR
jgi:hypothetical protein